MISEHNKKFSNLMEILGRFENRKSIFLLLLIFAIFFLPYLVGGKTLYPLGQGHSIQFFKSEASIESATFNPMYLDHGATDWIERPINIAANHAITEGEWPMWNPYSSLGMPILPNTNGATVAPLGIFLNFINSEFSWNAMYIGRLLFAVIFTFYFLRKLGLAQLSSVSGALLFGFSGYAQLHLNMFHFHVDAMVPFLFWSTLNFFQKKSSYAWLLLLLAIISIILGGNPQNLILACIVSSLFFLTLSLLEKKQGRYKDWLLYVLAFILAIGCCTFYGVSFYELFKRALKYHGGVGKFSLPMDSLLGLFFPVFFAVPGKGAIYLPYLGFLTIPIIISGLKLTGQFRLFTGFFLVTSVFFILKVVGFPLFNWIGGLPIFDNILFTKYLSPLYFSISVLFAISIQELLQGNPIRKFIISILISLVLLVTLYQHLPQDQKVIIFMLRWLLFIVLTGVTLILVKEFSVRNKTFVSAVVVCILCELLFNRMYNLNKTLNSGVAFSTPKFVTFIQTDRQHDYDRIFGVGYILMGNQASLYQLHDIRGLSATTYNRYYTFMKELVLGNQLDLHPFTTTSSTFHLESRPFINLLGVKYIIFDDCKTHQLQDLSLVHQERCMEVFKNNAAFKRAFVVHDYLEVDGDAAVLAEMARGKIDLSKTAIFNKEDHIIPNKIAGTVNLDKNEIVTIDSYKTNDVNVSVNIEAPGILILSDLMYPGWNVYVDDLKKEILNVDYLLRGVFVDIGQHKVRFSYEPVVLKNGLYISLFFVGLSFLMFKFFPWKPTHSQHKNSLNHE
jgi:hypothetical protein